MIAAGMWVQSIGIAIFVIGSGFWVWLAGAILLGIGTAMGLCKGNVATQLNQAFTKAIRDLLDRDGEIVDPRKYLAAGRSAQIEIVRERIRFFGASGKVH